VKTTPNDLEDEGTSVDGYINPPSLNMLARWAVCTDGENLVSVRLETIKNPSRRVFQKRDGGVAILRVNSSAARGAPPSYQASEDLNSVDGEQ
jgi:hypothetical protein